MELKKEQLQRIEHYLNVKDIYYIDLRVEIFDHIVSDIEAEILIENFHFETSFYKVTDMWNKQLKPSSSFYFGLAHSAPKIVLEKAKSYFKKWFLFIYFLFFLFMFLESKLKLSISENMQLYIANLLIVVNILFAIIYIFLMFRNSKIKDKTSYSFILKTQNLGLILGFIGIIFSGIIDKVTPIYSLTIMFIAVTFCYYHFLKKHKEAIKKYRI